MSAPTSAPAGSVVLELGPDHGEFTTPGRMIRSLDTGDRFRFADRSWRLTGKPRGHKGRRHQPGRPVYVYAEPLPSPNADGYLVNHDGSWPRPVEDCGHADPVDGTCCHPTAWTPECFVHIEGPSDCPLLEPAARR